MTATDRHIEDEGIHEPNGSGQQVAVRRIENPDAGVENILSEWVPKRSADGRHVLNCASGVLHRGMLGDPTRLACGRLVSDPKAYIECEKNESGFKSFCSQCHVIVRRQMEQQSTSSAS